MSEANADPGDVPFHPAVAPALLAATRDVYGNVIGPHEVVQGQS